MLIRIFKGRRKDREEQFDFIRRVLATGMLCVCLESKDMTKEDPCMDCKYSPACDAINRAISAK